MVKIKATGFGTTALKSGVIIHFDADEEKKPAKDRDMRKLEADVDYDDAVRIKEMGWATFANAKRPDADRAELAAEDVARAEIVPTPEAGVPSRQAPITGDVPAEGEEEAPAAPKPRKAAARKTAAKGSASRRKAPSAPVAPPAPAPEPVPDAGAGDAAQAGDDPEAGPA